MGMSCSQNGKKGRSAVKILTDKPSGKRTLGRHKPQMGGQY
jgi:hypothetical protein